MIETITQPPHPQFIIFLGETYEVNHHYFAIDGQHHNNTQIDIICIIKKYVDDYSGGKECLAIVCLVLSQMFGIRLF